MPHKIVVAQQVFDSINRKNGPISDDDLLPKLLPVVQQFPDAQNALNNDALEHTAVLTPGALKLSRLLTWADRVLQEEPTTLADFPRWAKHVAVFLPGRKQELGIEDKPTKSAEKAAICIIDVAWKLGIQGVKERPMSAITHAELWNIIDAICSARTHASPYTPLEQERMAKLREQIAPYINKGLSTDGPEYTKIKGLLSEYGSIGPKQAPDSLDKLKQEVIGHRVWAIIDQAQRPAEFLRDLHRRGERLGIPLSRLPALPTGTTKSADETEAWLIELEKCLDATTSIQTPAMDKPNDVQIDACVKRLGLKGDDYLICTAEVFKKNQIRPVNLRVALRLGEVKKHPTMKGKNQEGFFEVRSVVKRFYPKFTSQYPQ